MITFVFLTVWRNKIGTYLALLNHDDVFNRSPITPIIINDISTATEAERDYVNRLISTCADGDMLSNEPSCECGELKGGYNLGSVCQNCKLPVKELFDQELQTLTWMRSPNGVEKLINPMVLTQLSTRFTKSKFNLIEWLCNTDYHPSANKPEEVAELLAMGVKRGYNNFIQNFDAYIEILFSLKNPKVRKGEVEDLQVHLKMSRSCCLSWHLPLPNKSLLVIEKTQVGIFVDPIVVGAVDAIRTICSIDTELSSFTLKQKENRTAKTLFILANFCNEVYHDILASKNGLFRKHVFGGRNYFSARAVISSNTRVHNSGELQISWGAGVTIFKIHLMNKLFKLGWNPVNATAFLQKYTCVYHELLDTLFCELIDESPDKGIYAIFGRNPSLTRGSSQLMKITKIKTDVNDPTITMSILDVKGFNA